jgi:hypothetical protein
MTTIPWSNKWRDDRGELEVSLLHRFRLVVRSLCSIPSSHRPTEYVCQYTQHVEKTNFGRRFEQ